MFKASFVVNKVYQNNKIFNVGENTPNKDDDSPFVLLKKKIKEHNYDLSTNDIHNINQSDLIIYMNMPKKLPTGDLVNRSILLLYENETIKPDNWRMDKHNHFSKIFTWRDDLIDNIKYFKMNHSINFSNSIDKSLSRKQNLCTLIAGNKFYYHPLSLYSKRIEAIRWFETNHPKQFDLYGVGWDKYRYTGHKKLKIFKPFTKLFFSKYPSYKGQIKDKFPVLQRYKFSICYENARDIVGYITEKILDCFSAGCVPIYWGATNVTEHIPKECFINKRDFATYEDLYQFINNMSDNQYLSYLNNIEDFNKNKSKSFSNHFFSENIAYHASNL